MIFSTQSQAGINSFMGIVWIGHSKRRFQEKAATNIKILRGVKCHVVMGVEIENMRGPLFSRLG